MTRVEGMAVGMGVAIGMAEVEGEMTAVVELGKEVRVVELLEAVGLV